MSNPQEPKDKPITIVYDSTTVHLGKGFLISLGTVAQGLFVLRQYLETLKPEAEQNPYEREYNKLFVPELQKFLAFVDAEFCQCESEADRRVMMRFTNGRLPEPVPVRSLYTSRPFKPDLKFKNCMTNMNIILPLIHSRSSFGKTRKIPTHITDILNKHSEAAKLDQSVSDKLIEHSDEPKEDEITPEKLAEAHDIANYFGKYQERCGKLMAETDKLYKEHSNAHKAGLAAQPPKQQQQLYASSHPAAQVVKSDERSQRRRPHYQNHKSNPKQQQHLDKVFVKKVETFEWEMSVPELKGV